MKIQKCSDFINEKVKYKDLRWLIDGHGIAKNVHGTIEKGKDTDGVEKELIIGDDGKKYIAGFNMIFELVPGEGYVTNDGYLKTKTQIFDGRVLSKNKRLPNWNIYSDIVNEVKRVWTLEEIRQNNFEYAEPHQITEDLTIYNQSWVNVKVDMTISDKVSRHMKIFQEDGGIVINNNNIIDVLKERIEILSNPNLIETTNEWTLALQKKISAILCLRYLTEIKINFDPSSAGFIFESFLAGVVGGRAINDDSETDVVAGNTSFQLKFYGVANDYIPIFNKKTLTRLNIVRNSDSKSDNFESESAFLNRVKKTKIDIGTNQIKFDYALIGIKERNQIHMCLISKEQLHDDLNSMLKFRAKKLREGYALDKIGAVPGLLTSVGQLKSAEVKKHKLATLDLSVVSGNNLRGILHDLDKNISIIWKNVGELQENIESMTTGITKEGDIAIIEHNQVEAIGNLSNIRTVIKKGIFGENPNA